ncbi:NUDIX domain-containing protein, partial [Priestia koreensis]
MRRDRAGVIIRENERILLIKRVKNHELYYVFPGGGIEQ